MSADILPFAVAHRWTVTVESERRFVRKRHRTDWWTVSRRMGHPERRFLCASRKDALWLADQMRDHFERMIFAEQVKQMLDRLPPIAREQAKSRLWAMAAAEDPLANSPFTG
jgi:hypothetical protein